LLKKNAKKHLSRIFNRDSLSLLETFKERKSTQSVAIIGVPMLSKCAKLPMVASRHQSAQQVSLSDVTERTIWGEHPLAQFVLFRISNFGAVSKQLFCRFVD
jgi:hypothetical protein